MAITLHLLDDRAPKGFTILQPAAVGHINGGFAEKQQARLYLPSHQACELFIDDEPIASTRARRQMGWTWTPGFYAGTVRAELQLPDESTPHTYLLDVSPDPAKLGQDTFRELVYDILSSDPSLLLGDEPATTPAGGITPHDTLHLQYAMLFQYGQNLLEALRAIQSRPRQSLIASRVVVPLSRLRRADAHTALIMARNGSLPSLIAAIKGAAQPTERNDWRFNTSMSIESLDCPPTRCITALARRVLRRAHQVHAGLESLPEHRRGSKTHTALGPRLPRRLAYISSFIASLETLLAKEPFASVTRDELSAAALVAVSADPTYARAHHLTWEILRPRSAGIGTEDWSWMSPTWDLYEKWCFIKLTHALQQSFPNLTWHPTASTTADRALTGEGEGTRVQLLWQPEFRRDPINSPLSSISKPLRPDFALIVEHGSSRRWCVLDAKYSQASYTVLEAMHAAHVYHDALRCFDQPPDYSLLLLPSSGEDIDWLHEPAYRETNGVGVIACSPALQYRDTLQDHLLPHLAQRKPTTASTK